MRLLNVSTLELEKFEPDDIPSYVIASHRWTKGQEASFQDVKDVRNVDKSGYKKITGFARYVREHVPNVDWLWVDTCCIDDRHSQEVSEAINSMFKWYARAQVCLAYLADVDTIEIEDFIQSEWFSRGWTLQELLAPRAVVFLSSRWQVIGHKQDMANPASNSGLAAGRSLTRTISSVTKIPVEILNDYEQSKDLTVNDKQVWTSGRKTTREEDMCYCLFGIFDVAPGANYGEGLRGARRRLMNAIAEKSREDEVSRQATAGSSAIHHSASTVEQQNEAARTQELLDRVGGSLCFPQIEDRRDHISIASPGTYRWALLSTASTRWDNFVSWLREPQPTSRIYWISAKPGAGKSSLVRFLDMELQVDRDMQPWAGNSVFRLHYYFWNPGSSVQKSLTGLLRTVLYQIYEKSPQLLCSCLPPRKRIEIVSATHLHNLKWSLTELKELFRNFIYESRSSAKFFILIDGLDEVEGDENSRDELVDFLSELANFANIKLCVSSRAWTVFENAFAQCPHLRLEDLNAQDIETYVRDQLLAHQRYEQILIYEPTAIRLVDHVTRKAQGVFLWTRLVVKELTRGIRDGDDYHTLRNKLENMPADLNAYFSRLLDSIDPYHRRAASILLQVALHHEYEFVALNPLRLIDLIFLTESEDDFSLSNARERYIETFNDAGKLLFALDGAVRRLSSLCKGLLECYFDGGSTLSRFVVNRDVDGETLAEDWANEIWNVHGRAPRTVTTLPSSLLPVLHQHRYAAIDFRIDFMHRSLRDYLLEPMPMQFLTQQSGGQFNSRNYLRNARLAEIFMATSVGLEAEVSLGLASYVISTLSIPSFRNDTRCVRFMSTFRPLIPYLMQGMSPDTDFWYICRSLNAWDHEQSNFYALAIDFGLTGYLMQALSPDDIRSKCGRPLLDYALRVRFAGFLVDGGFSIGLQHPDTALVRHLLSLGANPNKAIGELGISTWALFLSYAYECVPLLEESPEGASAGVDEARTEYLNTIEVMITAGASRVLTVTELCARVMYGMYAPRDEPYAVSLWDRWPALAQAAQLDVTSGTRTIPSTAQFELSDILENLRPTFGARIDSLKTLAASDIRPA